MEKERKIIIIIIVFYLLYITLFLAKFDFNPSATIEISKNYPHSYFGRMPPHLVIHDSNGFDGQYYYFMALNPDLDDIDTNPAFLQRILYPILTVVFSLGVKQIFPIMMLLINFASAILSCCILLLFLRKYKASPLLALLCAINVGFLIAILRNLTEPLMMLLIIASIYFLDKKEYVISSIFLSFALLTRELAFTVYAAILLFFLFKKEFKNFFIFSLSIIPFCIWETILVLKKNTAPLGQSFFTISNPLIGFINYFRDVPLNLNQYIVNPALNNQLLTHEALTNVYNTFNVIPLLILIIIQLIIITIVFIKNKKITIHFLLLLSQITLFLALRKNLFDYHQIDGVGRYAIPLVFFAIIYYVKEKENFNKFLNFLSLTSIFLLLLNSITYIITRIIFFKSPFYIS
jgi:hypothetical protein